VTIDGTDIWGLSDDRLAAFRNRRLGFVFQFASLLPTLRLVDNVALPALLGKRGDSDVYGKAAMLLGRMGLGDHLDAYPSECSAGEQRRAAIARALINDPVLLLADEPSGNLDAHNADRLHDLFAGLARSYETAVVVVTHNVLLSQRADRVLSLEEGRLVPASGAGAMP